MARWSTIDVFWDWFVDRVRKYGLEQLTRRYYGTYRAFVEDVEDPENRGRVRLLVPALGHSAAPENIWARPIFPGSSMKHGHFFPPVKDDQVWCQFEGGDPNMPLYVGGFIAQDQRPDEFDSVLKRGVRTPLGHYIRYSDEPDDPHITVSMALDDQGNAGGYLTMDKDGSVLIANVNGSHLYLNAKDGQTTLMHETGAMVSMSDSGGVCVISADGSVVDVTDSVSVITPGDVTLNGGGTCLIKTGTVNLGDGVLLEGVVLESFLTQVFNTHTHIGVGNLGAPVSTLPPVAPAVPMVHSSGKVKAAK
jgi:hypothetical protein